MIKKLNNKILLIVFALLLALVLIMQVIPGSKGERNFREYLAEVDTTLISTIEFVKLKGEPITLQKQNTSWLVKQSSKQAKADKSAVGNILQSLSNLEVKRRVGTSKDQWEKYEVTDSMGTRLKIYSKDELLADIMVGRFSYKQRGRSFSLSTNARLFDEEETYTVEGNLSMAVKRDFNGLRDHTLVNINKDDIEQIIFNDTENGTYNLSKSGGQWLFAGEVADSAAVEKYFDKLSDVKAHNFTEGFSSENPVSKATIKLNSGVDILVEAYPEDEKYVLRSSQNQGAVFKESESIFKRVFPTKEGFKE